jgi:hypothetical protein
MKKLNNKYEAPKVEWVELFAENEVMQGGTNISNGVSESEGTGTFS